jgi:hypothetical protein
LVVTFASLASLCYETLARYFGARPRGAGGSLWRGAGAAATAREPRGWCCPGVCGLARWLVWLGRILLWRLAATSGSPLVRFALTVAWVGVTFELATKRISRSTCRGLHRAPT